MSYDFGLTEVLFFSNLTHEILVEIEVVFLSVRGGYVHFILLIGL